eukprot:360774-Chlamydomonas_euryale.AAC.13
MGPVHSWPHLLHSRMRRRRIGGGKTLHARRLAGVRPSSPPTISTSSWFSVFSRSSWPPIAPPRPRARPIASISSIKMMDGDWERAWANRSRTRAGPTPTNISIKSDPEMDRNGTLASPAVALASNVLPVPGGPTSSAPFGIFAPSSLYLSLCSQRRVVGWEGR